MKKEIVICKNESSQSIKKINCFVIHMSCGGGVGGSSWKEVALTKDNIDIESIEALFMNQKPIHVNTTRGKNRMLNSQYIVSISRSCIYIHTNEFDKKRYYIFPEGTECIKGDNVEQNFKLEDYMETAKELKIKDLFE